MFKPDHLAQASFKYFFKKVFNSVWMPHHDEWFELITKNQFSWIQCARGHGKTWFFIGYLLWLAYREMPLEILVISQSEEQIKLNVMNKIDEIIHNNPLLDKLRPSASQLWGAQLKTFKSGLQIRAESFGSSVRGAHPDILLVDDPLKDKGGMSPTEQGEYFLGALMGTTKKNTRVIVDGTPLDAGDLLEQIEKNPSFVGKKYPAENEDRTKVLFPYLFSKEDLLKIEARDGSTAYSRERLLQRIDPETALFKDRYRTLNTDLKYPEFAVVRTIIDPAISEKEAACDSAIVTVGVDYKNHRWELDTRLVHSDDPALLIKEVIKVVEHFQKTHADYAVVIEAELFQKVLANDMKQAFLDKDWSINVIEVTHQGIQGKHERIAGLQAPWEARAIHLLPESPLISQFRYYRPRIKGFKIDGLDAFAWSRAEDVAVPMTHAKPIDDGVPEDAWE